MSFELACPLKAPPRHLAPGARLPEDVLELRAKTHGREQPPPHRAARGPAPWEAAMPSEGKDEDKPKSRLRPKWSC